MRFLNKHIFSGLNRWKLEPIWSEPRDCLKFDEALQEIYFTIWYVHRKHEDSQNTVMTDILERFLPPSACVSNSNLNSSVLSVLNNPNLRKWQHPFAHTLRNQKAIPLFSHAATRMCVCVCVLGVPAGYVKNNLRKSSFNLQVPTAN